MKVLVTGADGMVGNALRLVVTEFPEFTFIFCTRKEADLTLAEQVNVLFEKHKPDYVIHTAAKTGGFKKDSFYPADRFYENVMMNSNLIHCSHIHGVKKMLALSSVACYDTGIEILTEEQMHFGNPHESFKFYGYAKRMMDIQIEAYNKQHKLNYSTLICGNIFGKHDAFGLEFGHVIPSLIHKCYLAKKNNLPFEVMGNGTPKREFIFSEDLARICLELLRLDKKLPQRIIVSGEKQITIKKLVEIISKTLSVKKISWEKNNISTNKSRKTDKKVLNFLLPNFKQTSFLEAIEETISWFCENYPNVRE